MPSANEPRAFTIIDDYARSKHQCFVAEMFLNKAGTEYVLCFRPTDVSNDATRFACRYVSIRITEIESIVQTGTIPISLANEIDRELLALRRSI